MKRTLYLWWLRSREVVLEAAVLRGHAHISFHQVEVEHYRIKTKRAEEELDRVRREMSAEEPSASLITSALRRAASR
jgi:hypothetical protein